MKASARHVPGSAPSCRTPLSLSAIPTRRFQCLPEKCVHYAYKMRPNFKMQISSRALSATYNFDPRKCTHFLALYYPAPAGSPSQDAEPCDVGVFETIVRHPFSLGKKLGMMDKPVTRSKCVLGWQSRSSALYQIAKTRQNETNPKTQNTGLLRPNNLRRHPCVSSHFQSIQPIQIRNPKRARVHSRSLSRNRTKQNDFRFRSISPTLYQRLTAMPSPIVRFSRGLSTLDVRPAFVVL
jgi:hypothetical protein